MVERVTQSPRERAVLVTAAAPSGRPAICVACWPSLCRPSSKGPLLGRFSFLTLRPLLFPRPDTEDADDLHRSASSRARHVLRL